MIAGATRCSATRATLLAVVSANAAGRAQEIAVRPVAIWTNRRRGVELRRFSKARSTPPMTAAMKVIWAKPASGILPCTASGTPAARRATAPAVVTAAARTPTETVVRASVLVNRDGTCSTVISGEVVTVDMVGSLFVGGGALCTAHHVHERRGRIRHRSPIESPDRPQLRHLGRTRWWRKPDSPLHQLTAGLTGPGLTRLDVPVQLVLAQLIGGEQVPDPGLAGVSRTRPRPRPRRPARLFALAADGGPLPPGPGLQVQRPEINAEVHLRIAVLRGRFPVGDRVQLLDPYLLLRVSRVLRRLPCFQALKGDAVLAEQHPPLAQRELRRMAALVSRVERSESVGAEVADHIPHPVLAGKRDLRDRGHVHALS